ncbi:MAG: protein TolQ [Pseudomonadota bacterium]|jgi:biopolymer transport protein TolQ
MTATTNDLDVIALMLQASIPVQAVVLVLIAVSVASWTVMFQKMLSLRRARAEATAFERQFWSGGDLLALYKTAELGQVPGGMARVFESGMREFLKLHQQAKSDAAGLVDAAQRAMRASSQRELQALEHGLPFLASVGSVSPYIGLFGTVWGIMHAFTGLANIQQATLASVAPGIAEALVATAIGLFAAIPAVIAYNRFATHVDQMAGRLEAFGEEFSNILQRQA